MQYNPLTITLPSSTPHNISILRRRYYCEYCESLPDILQTDVWVISGGDNRYIFPVHHHSNFLLSPVTIYIMREAILHAWSPIRSKCSATKSKCEAFAIHLGFSIIIIINSRLTWSNSASITSSRSEKSSSISITEP